MLNLQPNQVIMLNVYHIKLFDLERRLGNFYEAESCGYSAENKYLKQYTRHEKNLPLNLFNISKLFTI